MRVAMRLAFCLTLLVAGAACAQTADQRQGADAWTAAYAHGTAGPAHIPLGGAATLDLPESFVFVPAGLGRRLAESSGYLAGDTFLGVVIPAVNTSSWFIPISLRHTGHIDGRAVAALDPEEIRGTLAATIRHGNDARARLGIGPLDGGAFLEPPAYDPAQHRFTTAIRVFESGPTTADGDGAAITTQVYGRTELVEVSLIDGLGSWKRHRAAVDSIVGAVAFNTGRRADDFVRSADPVETHLLDVLFAGRSPEEMKAADAAVRVSGPLEATKTFTTELRLAFFAVLGIFAALMLFLAFSPRAGGEDERARTGGIDRLSARSRR